MNHFPEIGSTHLEATRRAAAGNRGPLWITAGRQTLGRGRSGRPWTSEAGNLSASLLFAPGAPARSSAPPMQEVAALSYAVALAVADTAEKFVDPNLISLKWPNDVLLSGAKLSGVLLEAGGGAIDRPPAWLAIGVGVNLTSHPETDSPIPATHLGAHTDGPPPTPETFRNALAVALDHWWSLWRQDGFAALRGPWLARAHGLGGSVTARAARETAHGIFETVDERGALVLNSGGARKIITAADVYFSSPTRP